MCLFNYIIYDFEDYIGLEQYTNMPSEQMSTVLLHCPKNETIFQYTIKSDDFYLGYQPIKLQITFLRRFCCLAWKSILVYALTVWSEKNLKPNKMFAWIKRWIDHFEGCMPIMVKPCKLYAMYMIYSLQVIISLSVATGNISSI